MPCRARRTRRPLRNSIVRAVAPHTPQQCPSRWSHRSTGMLIPPSLVMQGRSSIFPMMPQRAGRTSYHNQSPSLPSYRSYNGTSETSHSNMNSSVLTANLFDPEQPERPNTMFMGQLIQDFFNHLSSYFPFLNYDEVVQKFLTHSLSSLMANCIAALAARYVPSSAMFRYPRCSLATRYTNLPEVKQHGVSVAVDAYSTNAEVRRPHGALSRHPPTTC